jgi:hypothetical protein
MEAVGVDVRYVLTGMRGVPSGIDRERFRQTFSEVQRQAKVKLEKQTSAKAPLTFAKAHLKTRHHTNWDERKPDQVCKPTNDALPWSTITVRIGKPAVV